MTLNAILITGRTINQGATIENKTSSDYQEATALCELNSKDIGILGIKPGSQISVKTDHGDVVVNQMGWRSFLWAHGQMPLLILIPRVAECLDLKELRQG
jgi:formylmethanofuran dehydrogenase subunit D